MSVKKNNNYLEFIDRLKKTEDTHRMYAVDKRHNKNFNTARENLNNVVDKDSFLEFGSFAVAAQRNRRDYEDLKIKTSADGIITGFCQINSELIGAENSHAISIIYDYSVLAGTQGYFHHMKLDRICDKAEEFKLPVIIFTEGGGGRPGDTDVKTNIAGLHVPSFSTWARLSGQCLRIAINNGYCFAGNAALFGCADIRIATKQSWIGMAGPAMIEGGGLGKFSPEEIGPVEDHQYNGVVDYIAENETHGADVAKQLLSYFQGNLDEWNSEDQTSLRNILPYDRKWSYPVRDIIKLISDIDQFIELKPFYGKSIIIGFIRVEGIPFGLVASDCKHLGGAIDSESADKMSDFMELCSLYSMPIVSLVDTPGFMVGPESEKEGAVRRMSKLFTRGSKITTPLIGIFMRKGYGLGAQAMVGGSLHDPIYTAAWPDGEFGAMGLEGAVKLGFKKELESEKNDEKREQIFNDLVSKLYEKGKAIEAAAHLEIDAVIDPADTRQTILKAIKML